MIDPAPEPAIRLKLTALGDTFLETGLAVDSGQDCIVDDGQDEAIRIHESSGSLQVTPLTQEIPVFLDGNLLSESSPLADNDVLQFGESAEITVTIEPPAMLVSAAASGPAPAAGSSKTGVLIVAALIFLLCGALGFAVWFQSRPTQPDARPPVEEAAADTPPPVNTPAPVPSPDSQPQVQLRAVAPDILEVPPLPPPEESPQAPPPGEWTIDLKSEVGCLVWNQPSGTLLAGLGDGRVVEINPENGETLRDLQAHNQSVAAIALTQDGSRIATASYDNTVRIFRSLEDKNPQILSAHVNAVRAIDFHPYEPLLASAGADGFVMLWNTESGADTAWLLAHMGMVNSVKFSPDGSSLFSAGSDGTIQVWEARSGKKIATLPGPQSGINMLAFSPDGKRLISASDGFLSAVDGIVVTPEQTLRFWDPSTLQEIPQSVDIEDWLLAAGFTSDGHHILLTTGGHPANPRDPVVVPRSIILNATTGAVIGARGGPLGPLTGIVPHPDGDFYFTSSTDQMVRRLTLPAGPAKNK